MKMDDRGKNILAGVVSVGILWMALTVTFTPDLSLGNMLLSMAQMPGNLFRFAWEPPVIQETVEETLPQNAAAAPKPTEPQPTETKIELPLVFFDDDTETENVPVIINPVDGINELPEILFGEPDDG